MADTKTTGLPEDTAPTVDDLVMMVDDPAGTPANKKAAAKNLWKVLPRAAAEVRTDETQANGAGYGNLATAGPSVTLTLQGTVAIVWISALAYRTGGSGQAAKLGVAVSGTTTIAATDESIGGSPGANIYFGLNSIVVLTGLTPGSTTFTLQYSNDGGGTWHYLLRKIAVFAP